MTEVMNARLVAQPLPGLHQPAGLHTEGQHGRVLVAEGRLLARKPDRVKVRHEPEPIAAPTADRSTGDEPQHAPQPLPATRPATEAARDVAIYRLGVDLNSADAPSSGRAARADQLQEAPPREPPPTPWSPQRSKRAALLLAYPVVSLACNRDAGDGRGEIGFGALQTGLDIAYGHLDIAFTWVGFDEIVVTSRWPAAYAALGEKDKVPSTERPFASASTRKL